MNRRIAKKIVKNYGRGRLNYSVCQVKRAARIAGFRFVNWETQARVAFANRTVSFAIIDEYQ